MKLGDIVRLNTVKFLGMLTWDFKLENGYPNDLEPENTYGLIISGPGEPEGKPLSKPNKVKIEIRSDYYKVKQLSTGIVEEFTEDELIVVQ